MLISPQKQKLAKYKTACRCAICGERNDLVVTGFIPEWTRIVGQYTDKLIPLCNNCFINTRYKFIELGSLRYLPEVFIQQLMRYYKPIAGYLYKYIYMYGKYRTNNMLDVDKACLVLSSYDVYIQEHEDELNWEDLKKS